MNTYMDDAAMQSLIEAVMAQPTRAEHNAWLRSQVTQCLTEAQTRITCGLYDTAETWLRQAHAYARQLGNAPEYRILRGHIIDALDAVQYA